MLLVVSGAVVLLSVQHAAAQCQVQKITVEDAGEDEGFAYALAVVGEAALIGLPGDGHGGGGIGGVGSAFLFGRRDNVWVELCKLTADDGARGHSFGGSVALDYQTILIGANGDDDLGPWSGSAYVFQRDTDGNWSQVTKLLPDDGDDNDWFGWSVALDDRVAVVGAANDEDFGYAAGSAYVFERQPDGSWVQVAKIVGNDVGGGDEYGDVVALSGNVAVVGANGDDDLGFSSGAAYVFERGGDGTWSQVGKLLASDGNSYHNFGWSVSVDGQTILVGAEGARGWGSGSGAAYVFERSTDGQWIETAKLAPEDAFWNQRYGWAVAIGGDMAVVGASYDDDAGRQSGSAYVYVRDADGGWSHVAKLIGEGIGPDDWFGSAVAVSGNIALIGAWREDDYGPESGAAFVFAVGPDADGDGVMDACECPGDLNKDWIVDYRDLGMLLTDWGCESGDCAGDIDRDGDTDQADLGLLLAYWGEICP